MCTRPITHNGNTFACRSCDECIATRRHGWVARAMMEKASHPFAMCLALTYGNSTKADRDAAEMFAYIDVRAFLSRLRAAMRRLDPSAVVRFLCAGEQGDRYARCHWHMIIYSTLDLCSVGEFSGRFGPILEREKLLSVGKVKRRLNWTLWPHGFVTLQEPDQGAMNYVLSYVLKDQFTEEKSRGTMREAKSENFATGLFRMSKRPAIGESFLFDKLAKLDELGACLPSLNLKVPHFHGYYQPSGAFRDKLLWGLVALNQRVLWSTGAPAPQWASLIASCSENPAALEVLNGPIKEEDAQSYELELEVEQRERSGFSARREFAKVCGAELPCESCLGGLSDETLDRLGVERFVEFGTYAYRAKAGSRSVSERQHTAAGRSNEFCQKRGARLSRLTFPDSDRTRF